MRYHLAHSRDIKKNRWNNICPSCGQRKFSPYIDTVTGKPIAEKECGRCCRERSCAYHMPPREWFKDNPPEKREWLPREQYIELMRQRRREARVASQRDIMSYPLPLRGLPLSQRESADSPIAERDTAERLTEKNCRPLRGTSGESEATERRGYEAKEYCERMSTLCTQSRSDANNLARWLATRFPEEQVAQVLARYRTGSTRDGRIIYWQIDEQGQVHAGKVMAYDPTTGHRVKESSPPLIPPRGEGQNRDAGTPPPWGRSGGGQPPVCWVHSMKIDGIKFDEMLAPQCLFGLHLTPLLSPQGGMTPTAMTDPLRTTCSSPIDPHPAFGLVPLEEGTVQDCAESTAYKTNQKELSPFKGDERRELGERSGGGKEKSSSSLALQAATPPLVMLVESEKTALIMSLVCPDRVWLATGGKQNLKETMLRPLIGYEVEVYPDADALADWYTRTVEMNRTIGTHLHIPTWYYDLMNHDEARNAGLDLADILMSEE